MSADTSIAEKLGQIADCHRNARVRSQLAEGKTDREKLIDARIEQQLLYEKWIKLDEWSLRGEAIALLIGAEPENWKDFLVKENLLEKEQAMWDQVQHAVEQEKTLEVINPAELPEEWRVIPIDIHFWSRTKRIPVPSAFDMLINFVTSSVKQEEDEKNRTAANIMAVGASSSEREKILGAALALVTIFPEKCRDRYGWVNGSTVAPLIEEKRAIWFDRDKLPASDEIASVIDYWVKTLE